jgi:hypothetical protein
MYPHVVSRPQDCRAWCIALAAFAVLFLMFLRLPPRVPKMWRGAAPMAGYGIAAAMLLSVHYAGGRTFDPAFSNIIILVLANMAVFGATAYLFTARSPQARLLLLPFIMAILLAADSAGSWNARVYHYTPLPWLYSFRFLKYMFIVIPGSMAGEYVRQWMRTARPAAPRLPKREKQTAAALLAIAAGLIVFNLYGLFTRSLLLNLSGTAALLAAGRYLAGRAPASFAPLWKKLFTAGACLLLLGLFFEAYEGGIRKDPSTFGYYFVTSGLAFMALLAFSVLCDCFRCRKSTAFLVMTGRNPMIAYVSSSLVVLPLLHLTHLLPLIDAFADGPWTGFLRGVLITALVTLLTMYFTKIKCFWRT